MPTEEGTSSPNLRARDTLTSHPSSSLAEKSSDVRPTSPSTGSSSGRSKSPTRNPRTSGFLRSAWRRHIKGPHHHPGPRAPSDVVVYHQRRNQTMRPQSGIQQHYEQQRLSRRDDHSPPQPQRPALDTHTSGSGSSGSGFSTSTTASSFSTASSSSAPRKGTATTTATTPTPPPPPPPATSTPHVYVRAKLAPMPDLMKPRPHPPHKEPEYEFFTHDNLPARSLMEYCIGRLYGQRSRLERLLCPITEHEAAELLRRIYDAPSADSGRGGQQQQQPRSELCQVLLLAALGSQLAEELVGEEVQNALFTTGRWYLDVMFGRDASELSRIKANMVAGLYLVMVKNVAARDYFRV